MKTRLAVLVAVLSMGVVAVAQKQESKPSTLKFALVCGGGDCPLLKGAPQTSGMRGGSVRLAPGKSVGWHSTAGSEESLVILKGTGVVKIDGQADTELLERELVYIPPQTRHNVTNTGKDTLEYVWVVAPVK